MEAATIGFWERRRLYSGATVLTDDDNFDLHAHRDMRRPDLDPYQFVYGPDAVFTVGAKQACQMQFNRSKADVESTQLPEERQVAGLHPLTPEYKRDKHKVYFDAIEDALGWVGDKAVRNIALTGSYGVGKSSILRQVASGRGQHVIQVSLSSLGFETDKSTSKVGTDGESEPSILRRETKTNQIQKEIVKQLLYTQMPEKMPGSRYRRTSAFDPKRAALFALASGIPVALIFFLLGWTSKLAALFTIPADWSIAANGCVAVVSAAFVFAVRYAMHNKIRIDSVSAGAATITLSSASDTYFDEYLDEIVYFFQVVDADLVIFEDIDRFEDAHIFETLRELNTILNAAKQLDGRAIRFLYAIKDSIFEELGVRAAREAGASSDAPEKPAQDAAMLEVARANRTKFFDLVIPVVPFITHQSARELMSGELADISHSVSDDLIDLVAQRVADMRLIKNIRNEFVIFQEHVIRKSSLELSDDPLFAMVLYKSTHLTDFERIKLGTSNLDILYRESRQLVQENTVRLNAEISTSRRRLRNVTNQSVRSQKVGDAVDAYIELLLGHMGLSLGGISYDGTKIPSSDLRTKAFWQRFVDGEADLAFSFNDPYWGTRTSVLPREELERATGESLDPARWESVTRSEIDAEIAAYREEIAFLSTADMRELMARTDLKLNRASGSPVSFTERATSLLGSKLAVELVAQGYVNRYFTLYTSTFVGDRVNANSMNFILKNVDAGSMDFYFGLTAEEAKTVLHERPRLALREKSAYNLDFMDYLLSDDAASAEIVLANLRRNGDDERQFLRAYLLSERDIARFVRQLARTWPDVLVFLLTDVDLDDDRRMQAVDAAFAGLADGVEYSVSDDLRTYLRANYASLSAFSGTQDEVGAGLVAKVVVDADFLIPDLAPLSNAVLQAIVEVERFELTRNNLLIAVDPSVDLSLDALQNFSEHVYRRVISDVALYLSILDDDERTVLNPDTFVAIIEDVDEADRGSLDAVVGRSTDACRVRRLAGVVPGAWPALASHARFPSEFENVVAYIEEYGVDTELAVVLGSGTIQVADGLKGTEMIELASVLIRSSNALPSHELRASLLESLDLPEYLNVSSVPAEPGEWVGRLLEHSVIADDAESFALIASDDWRGLEYAIQASGAVIGFISPDILPPSALTLFLSSRMVPEPLKQAVVERFTEFAVGAGRDALQALGAYALEHGIQLSWDNLIQIARGRVDRSLTLTLLQPFLGGASLEHLVPVLEMLGGDYPAVGAPNGKRRRFANTEANRALLERLKELETVNTIVPDGAELKVNMKKR